MPYFITKDERPVVVSLRTANGIAEIAIAGVTVLKLHSDGDFIRMYIDFKDASDLECLGVKLATDKEGHKTLKEYDSL